MKSLLTLLVMALALNASAAEQRTPVRIGLSLDTLKEERWQRDRDYFVKRAEELGATVLVQAANNNEATQAAQIENLLTQNIDVLVIVPHNSVTSAKSVNLAKKAGVKVVSYDRLVMNSDVDLYVSFDNVEVGRLQAEYLIKHAPKGNYVLIGGSPLDNNAKLFREGQMLALQPLIAKKEIQIVSDQWARDWQASEALKHTELLYG